MTVFTWFCGQPKRAFAQGPEWGLYSAYRTKKKDRQVRNHSPVRGFQIIVQLHTSSMEVLFITSWLLKIAINKVIFHGYECVLRFLIVLGLVEYLIILLVLPLELPIGPCWWFCRGATGKSMAGHNPNLSLHGIQQLAARQPLHKPISTHMINTSHWRIYDNLIVKAHPYDIHGL